MTTPTAIPTGVVWLPLSQLVVRVLLPESLGPDVRWLAESLDRDVRWLGSDVALLLGSQAPFKKLQGKRVLTGWAKFHGVLWPRDAWHTAFMDHGLGNTTVSTAYMISMIYWGFAAPREKWQRASAAHLLTDLVNLTARTQPGFQLFLPQPGSPEIEVDWLGCFELKPVRGLASHAPASRTMGVRCKWGILDELPHRPHIAAFIVAVLTPEHCFPGWWTDVAVWFLRQLRALVNGMAPRIVCGPTLLPEKPTASEVGSASTDLSEEEEGSGLSWLPSLVELEAALQRV